MNAVVPPGALAADEQDLNSWHASLSLLLQASPRGTRLARCVHKGPLYVQKPFYPEGKAHPHVYLLHPPGGIVSGDSLTIDIDLGKGSGALITTPGAARIYRAREIQPMQRQRCHFKVAEDAILEWFPLETIVFPGACVELSTTIELQAGARFVGWEVSCFGLPASGETFSHGSFCQNYRIVQDGVPLFIDRLQLDDSNRQRLLDGRAGLQQAPVAGFFLAGPMSATEGEQVLAALRDEPMGDQLALSFTGGFIVGRYLGDSAETARKLFGNWWRILRPLFLARPACAPRIWST